MTSLDILLALHMLSLFLMMAGLGAVIVALWRGWTEEDPDRALIAFEDASTGHKAGLLPGSIAVGATGIFLAGDADYNFITTGWLLALELVYLFVLLICVPLLGHALNRVQIEVLKSKKKGEATEALSELLSDNVPIVICIVIVFTIPFMVWLPVFHPF
ncbi:MAG TPA: DUF2269 family protein [Dehalococcoidia bacterium]|nr:DUF2269 family protein [Dehalococcoidia bacterium]